MNIPLSKAVLPTLITSTLFLAGCGGSSTTSNTTTTASRATSGIITGFGSVFVNGVEFDTSSTRFDVDNNTGSSQADLRVGMRVKVTGTVSADGTRGKADTVVYSSELKGPVSDLVQTFDTTVVPKLLVSVTLTIMKQQIEVNTDTTFDSDFGLTMDTLQIGDFLEVSGFSSKNGIVATHIEKQPASEQAEIKGEITLLNLDSMSFEVRGVAITYDSNTVFDEGLTMTDLADGLYVVVKGTYNTTTGSIVASKIEAAKDRLDDSDSEVEIEGMVADYDSTAMTFSVQGQVVDYSGNPKMEPTSLQLADGVKVEVEGEMIDGTLVAAKIKQRGQKIKVQAKISSLNDIDTADPSISLSLFGGDSNITVRVNSQTEMKDKMGGGVDNFMISNLAIGDYVEIKAFYDGTPVINAVKLERVQMDKIRLQGPLSAFDESAQTVTMFDQNFDLSGVTRYKGKDKELTTATDFFAALTEGLFIKLTDKDDDGVIDEAELDN